MIKEKAYAVAFTVLALCIFVRVLDFSNLLVVATRACIVRNNAAERSIGGVRLISYDGCRAPASILIPIARFTLPSEHKIQRAQSSLSLWTDSDSATSRTTVGNEFEDEASN